VLRKAKAELQESIDEMTTGTAGCERRNMKKSGPQAATVKVGF
jgi:hypothetical protein